MINRSKSQLSPKVNRSYFEEKNEPMTLLQGKLSLILILAVIFSFGFGMATMRMDENGNMSDCPFADTAAICPMSFAEHIAIFQSSFGAIPSKMTLSLVLALASLLILYSKLVPKIYSPPIKLLYFTKYRFKFSTHNKILIALSDGIIQPKLYA